MFTHCSYNYKDNIETDLKWTEILSGFLSSYEGKEIAVSALIVTLNSHASVSTTPKMYGYTHADVTMVSMGSSECARAHKSRVNCVCSGSD
jgi:hypothetical protein